MRTGITFIRYAQNQDRRKPNNLNILYLIFDIEYIYPLFWILYLVCKHLHLLKYMQCVVLELKSYSNMTAFKRFESKPVVKIIYTYTHCNLWSHRQFITIFYQFLHIRIETKPYVYVVFTTGRPLCQLFTPR